MTTRSRRAGQNGVDLGKSHDSRGRWFNEHNIVEETDECGSRYRPERAHDRALEIDIAEKLKALRYQLYFREPYLRNNRYTYNRFSQQKVAERAALKSKVSLCHYETGVQYPSTFAQWQRWARALGGKLKIELELPND